MFLRFRLFEIFCHLVIAFYLVITSDESNGMVIDL